MHLFSMFTWERIGILSSGMHSHCKHPTYIPVQDGLWCGSCDIPAATLGSQSGSAAGCSLGSLVALPTVGANFFPAEMIKVTLRQIVLQVVKTRQRTANAYFSATFQSCLGLAGW